MEYVNWQGPFDFPVNPIPSFSRRGNSGPWRENALLKVAQLV